MKCKRSGNFFKKLTVIVILIIGGLTMHWTFCSAHEKGSSRFVNAISNKLNLSEKQKEQLVLLKEEAFTAKEEIEASRRNLRTDFLELVARNELSEDKLLQLIKPVQLQVDVMAPQIIKKVVAFNASLNDKQREKLVDEMHKHSNRRISRGFFSGRH